MRYFLLMALIAATALGASVATAREWGDLKVRFVYGGEPPEPAKIQPDRDVEFCGQHDLIDESLLVQKDNHGIRNVFMYVYTGRGGTKLPAVHPALVAQKGVEVTARGCRIEPHIAIMQAGDELVLNPADSVGHNFNLSLFANNPTGFTIPPNGKRGRRLEEAEPAPIPLECNIHPWMKGYVIVVDHPYAAVSDENGVLVIKNLPAGETLSFRVGHEVGPQMEGLEIGSGKVSRNRVELEIAPGMNDLGEVILPAELFRQALAD